MYSFNCGFRYGKNKKLDPDTSRKKCIQAQSPRWSRTKMNCYNWVHDTLQGIAFRLYVQVACLQNEAKKTMLLPLCTKITANKSISGSQCTCLHEPCVCINDICDIQFKQSCVQSGHCLADFIITSTRSVQLQFLISQN